MVLSANPCRGKGGESLGEIRREKNLGTNGGTTERSALTQRKGSDSRRTLVPIRDQTLRKVPRPPKSKQNFSNTESRVSRSAGAIQRAPKSVLRAKIPNPVQGV